MSIVPELALPTDGGGAHAFELGPPAGRSIVLALPADALPAAVSLAEPTAGVPAERRFWP